MTTERWRWVRRYKGYYKVSTFGRVKSVERIADDVRQTRTLKGKILKQARLLLRGEPSYKVVNLYKHGAGKVFRTHRLVLEAFVGPCPDGMECRHLDGDKTNNRLKNLLWGTKTENEEDKTRIGVNCGEKCSSSKLTAKQVRYIIRNPKGLTQKRLGEKFGVHRSQISKIQSGNRWLHEEKVWQKVVGRSSGK